ncbi:MAG: hypothetical protein AUJ49_01760 [Desulfovibrionaceae bacterium CG1_02_65_16]|nr:MAG: hypothetical protein AUJ49_01760 [Desulfovibrionaceae bacterium CG1_02_65_16]
MPDNAPGNAQRPLRPRILDELGLPKTLPAAADDFLPLLDGGPDTLLLGLGPEPAKLPALLGLPDAQAARVRYIEAPAAAAQLGEAWRAGIPANFEAVTAPSDAEALRTLTRASRVLLYRPGPRLLPGFWGPLLARLRLALLPQPPAPKPRLLWLPGGEADLLRLELREAFEALGWRVRELPSPLAKGESALPALLAGGECPALYLSINFQGLDALGEAAHLLAAAGARVAVWCVDNPLNLLSRLKARFWMDLPLFVTDDWFLEPLTRLGARGAHHLPLAARARQLADEPQTPAPAKANLAGRLVFVGRSAFPDKAAFFAGCAVPDAARTEATRLMAAGGRPDFGWWLTRLGVERLWPGADARHAAFCAEETGKTWRAACLNRAQADLPGGLTVFGDAGWRELLPADADLRPPVDYYTALPDICASAAACLNCTSPLLPRGLTQRHFDVWASGGLLITDATPGLGIFPHELTRPITFARPEDIAPLLRSLTATPNAAAHGAALRQAWRAELARAHTYVHRAQTVLETLDLA